MKKLIFSLLLTFSMITVASAAVPKPGDSAPDFNLVSTDGQKVSLSDLKGKVVLIGMFHICVPCMNQAMEFNKVREAIPADKLAILGINTSGDSKKAVLDYLSQFPSKTTFPYLVDPDQQVYGAYGQRDMPTVLIIDKTGTLRARTPGVDADQLIPYINKLL